MWPMKMTSSTTRTKSLILMRMMGLQLAEEKGDAADRKSTRLNSSHLVISYAVFCLKKKNEKRADRDIVVTLTKEKFYFSSVFIDLGYRHLSQFSKNPYIISSSRYTC